MKLLIVSVPTVSVALVGFGSSHSPELGLTSELIFSTPRVGTGLGVVPAAVDFVGTHTKWWVASQNPTSLVNSPWGGICSGSFPSENAPVPPTSHCSLEPDLGASTPITVEQTLPPTGLWQPQSKREVLPNNLCMLWSPQHETHPPSRGQWLAQPEERHSRQAYKK